MTTIDISPNLGEGNTSSHEEVPRMSGLIVAAKEQTGQDALAVMSPETVDEKRKESFEYRDIEGNIICTAEATYALGVDSVDTVRYGIRSCRLLTSFVLTNSKGERFNLYDYVNSRKTPIYIVPDLPNYHYDSERSCILAPPLQSLMGVGIMLHELGHADQHQDPAFAELVELRACNPADEDKVVSFERFVKIFRRNVLDLRKILKHQGITREAVELDLQRYHGVCDELKRDESAFNDLDNRKKRNRKEVLSYLPFKSDRFYDLQRLNLKDLGFIVRGQSGSSSESLDEKDLLAEEDMRDNFIRNDLMNFLFDRSRPHDISFKYFEESEVLQVVTEIGGDHFIAPGIKSPKRHVVLNIPIRKGHYVRMMDRISKYAADVEKLKSKLEEKIATAKCQRDEIYARIKGFTEGEMDNVIEKIFERDATRREFKWLTEVKKLTGVDLFARFVLPVLEKTFFEGKEVVFKSRKDDGSILTSIVELHSNALASYDAKGALRIN